MFHVLESFCMLAVLRGSMLHVQHLSCRERYATCIMKTQGMVSFGTPILRVKSTWVSKGYQNLPKHSIRSGSDNECGLEREREAFYTCPCCCSSTIKATGQRTQGLQKFENRMICARLDLATLSVLDSRDNQLHQQTSRSEWMPKWPKPAVKS